MSDKPQTEFTKTYRFASRCSHCGKPMYGIQVDRFDREPGPLGAMFERDVYVLWVNPEHDCTRLSISARDAA